MKKPKMLLHIQDKQQLFKLNLLSVSNFFLLLIPLAMLKHVEG